MDGIIGFYLLIGVIIGVLILMPILRRKGIGGQLTGASAEPLFSDAPSRRSRLYALGLAILFGSLFFFIVFNLWFTVLLIGLIGLLLLYAVGITAPLIAVQNLFSSGTRRGR